MCRRKQTLGICRWEDLHCDAEYRAEIFESTVAPAWMPPVVGEGLAEIKATNGEACVSKRLAQMAYINRRDHTTGNAAVAATLSIVSARRISQKQNAKGEGYEWQYKL